LISDSSSPLLPFSPPLSYPLFRAMFTSGYQESSLSTLKIDDCSYETFPAFFWNGATPALSTSSPSLSPHL